MSIEELEVEGLLSIYSSRPHSPEVESLFVDLDRGLQHLDKRYKLVVWEHGIEGRPFREVASRHNFSHTLAWRYYRRAICQLANYLRP